MHNKHRYHRYMRLIDDLKVKKVLNYTFNVDGCCEEENGYTGCFSFGSLYENVVNGKRRREN